MRAFAPRHPGHLRTIRIAAWTAVVVLACFEGYAHRYSMNPDGVAYLDLSDAVVRGQWSGLVNLYWSPLYPLVLGLARAVTRVGPVGEFQLVHAMNVACFLVMFAAFEYFLFSLLEVASRIRRSLLHTTTGVALVYALVIATALTMTPIEVATPDLLAAATAFVALGALLRLRHFRDGDPRRLHRDAVVLGVALGLGLLAKSFFVPWGIVCLGVLAVAMGRARRGVTLRAGAVWLVFALPWTALLTHRAHRLTFGDTGRLTYIWYVNGQYTPSFGGVPPQARTPAIDAILPGAGIAPHGQGTDPFWFDPERWNAGLSPEWSADAQLGTIKVLVIFYVQNLSPLLLAFFFLAIAPGGTRREMWSASWVVLVPTLTGVAAYAAVVVTARYIQPFLIAGTVALVGTLRIPNRVRPNLVFLGALIPLAVESMYAVTLKGFVLGALLVAATLFGALVPVRSRRSLVLWILVVLLGPAAAYAVLAPGGPAVLHVGAALAAVALWRLNFRAIRRHEVAAFSARMQAALAVGFALVMLGRFGVRMRDEVRALAHVAGPKYHNLPAQIAAELASHGIGPGTRIALIGPHAESYWVRTARLQIAADVPMPVVPGFWALTPAQRSALLAQFAAAGATVVVAEVEPPPAALAEGWTPVNFRGWIRPLGDLSVK